MSINVLPLRPVWLRKLLYANLPAFSAPVRERLRLVLVKNYCVVTFFSSPVMMSVYSVRSCASSNIITL